MAKLTKKSLDTQAFYDFKKLALDLRITKLDNSQIDQLKQLLDKLKK
jgi:hypothetical protein